MNRMKQNCSLGSRFQRKQTQQSVLQCWSDIQPCVHDNGLMGEHSHVRIQMCPPEQHLLKLKSENHVIARISEINASSIIGHILQYGGKS